MAGEWSVTTLGSIVDFLSGGTPRKDRAEFWGGVIPWVSAKDMKHFRIDDTEDHVTEMGVENGTRLIPAGTVLLLSRGMTLLNELPICVATRPMTFNQDVKALRPKSAIRGDFLPYLLLGNKGRLLSLVDLAGHGTGRLNSDELKGLEVVIPPEDEQSAIAHILGTLDEKIELNRRMNETLEAFARAIFKSWFIDFDPVRAKMEGRWRKGESLPGLPAHLFDIFPDRLVDSELGEIPEGWEVRKLAAVSSVITKGTTPTKQDIDAALDTDVQVSYVRVNAIGDDGTILYDKLIKIPESVHLGVLKRSVLCENDVLYTIAGTIGRASVVEATLLPANVNQAVAIIRPASSIPSDFLTLMMRQTEFRGELHSNIVHAVQANLSLGVLSESRAVFPPEVSLPLLFKPIEDIMRLAKVNRVSSRTLAALRDALLPKLVSGELALKYMPAKL